MSDYQLDRFPILLVEDNSYIRQTIEDLLRSFRIGRIATAVNGEDAIAYLKDMKRVQNPGPDIIISDMIMSPINGLLLLRWVRTSKESPNRFVPYIMLSGAADREYVASARDLGTSEFLAKPFSVNSVFTHLAQVIERPRPVIATQKYFGPCRRRNRDAGPPGGEERRRLGHDHVTYVYSAEKNRKSEVGQRCMEFQSAQLIKRKARRWKGRPTFSAGKHHGRSGTKSGACVPRFLHVGE